MRSLLLLLPQGCALAGQVLLLLLRPLLGELASACPGPLHLSLPNCLLPLHPCRTARNLILYPRLLARQQGAFKPLSSTRLSVLLGTGCRLLPSHVFGI